MHGCTCICDVMLYKEYRVYVLYMVFCYVVLMYILDNTRALDGSQHTWALALDSGSLAAANSWLY